MSLRTTFLPLLLLALITAALASNLIPARSLTRPSNRLFRRQREQPPVCTASEPECGPFCLVQDQECCGRRGDTWYYCQVDHFCFKDTLQCCPDGSTDEECALIVTPVDPPPPGPTTSSTVTEPPPTVVTDPAPTSTSTSTSTEEVTVVEPEISTEILGTGTGGPLPAPTNGTITVPAPTATPPPEATGGANVVGHGGDMVVMGMGAFVAWVVGGL